MTFSDSLAEATQDGICTLIDGFGRFSELMKRTGIAPGSQFSVNYWRALSRRVCNKEQPGEDPPIEGGQCPVQYNVTVTWTRSTGFSCTMAPQSVLRTVWGPITGLSIENLEPDEPVNPSWRIELTCFGNGPTPTAQPVKVLVSQFTNAGDSCPDPEIQDVSIARVDGLPDDCPGYIPPNPPPPGWNNIIINNFTWVNNEGDVINEGDLGLIFGFAYFNDSFDLDVPIKVDVGGINFNGTFNFDRGAFEFDFSRDIINNNGPPGLRPPDGPGGDAPPSLPGAPDSPDDIEPDPDVREDDDNEDGEDEGESRIVALRVVVTAVNNESIGTFIQRSNPDIAIPNYGYVQFFIPTGEGEGGWTADIPIKNANHFVPCPWPEGATNARGTARQGVSWTIQALRSKISTKITYP